MFSIAVFIFIFSLGTVLALLSMREYSPRKAGKGIKSTKSTKGIKKRKVQLKGEVGLKEAGEIVLPRGHKRV